MRKREYEINTFLLNLSASLSTSDKRDFKELIYDMFVLIALTALLIAFWLLYNYLIRVKILLCCFYQDYVGIVD